VSCAGNHNLHGLTEERQNLHVELRDWEGNMTYAKYDNFKVGGENEQYELISVGSYTGDAGQSRSCCDVDLNSNCFCELEDM